MARRINKRGLEFPPLEVPPEPDKADPDDCIPRPDPVFVEGKAYAVQSLIETRHTRRSAGPRSERRIAKETDRRSNKR